MTEERRLEVGLMGGGDLARVRWLESLPIDALWTGGHIASRNPSPEAMMNLAKLAALTERVRIGTSILLLPLYPPALIAKQTADLDNACGGRVTLGVGVGGEYEQEFRAMEVPVSERGPRTDEAMELLRRFWTAEPISHDGRFFSFEDVRIHPAPVQPGGVPIVVAGRKPPAMRRAALLGDGWMPYLYSPRRYAASVETIRQKAADAGRSLDGFGWYAFCFLTIGDDSVAAKEACATAIGGNYNQDFRQMIDRVAAAGTVADVTARLIEFVDAGARKFVFTPMGPDTDTTTRRLLDEVMPAVEAHARARTP
jgi:probable F420-dependent oxidoreductase